MPLCRHNRSKLILDLISRDKAFNCFYSRNTVRKFELLGRVYLANIFHSNLHLLNMLINKYKKQMCAVYLYFS